MAGDPAVPVTAQQEQNRDTPAGFAFAVGAYALWGFLPLYMKALAHVSPVEIVVHRAFWSVPVAGILLIILRRTADIKAAFRSPRTLAMAVLTAGLISLNWGLYVWAVAVDRALETALGYYINPLYNVVLGALLLGEKLTRAQTVSVALAVLAVVVLTVDAGGLPWISLALPTTFGLYGFFRKTLPIGPSQGFFLETLILSVPAVGYFSWLAVNGNSVFLTGGTLDVALLIGCGPVTAIPLLLYAFGAKALRFTTIGLLQYIAPTLIFLIAVFVFGEPFTATTAIAFALIWTALVIYSWSMVQTSREK